MYLTAKMGPNGFGNEFVKLAKLLICRKVLGLPIAPAYWRSPYVAALPPGLCYTGRANRVWRLAAERLAFRKIEFGREEHLATGAVAMEEALRRFMEREQLCPDDRVVIEFDGLEPGLEAIEGHGTFLHDTLRAVPATAQVLRERFLSFDSRQLWVGVHIRQGDFHPALPLGVPWPQGEWGIQIPLEWYDLVCSRMVEAFPGRIRFFVTTNGSDARVKQWCDKFGAVLSQPAERRMSPDIADLLTLAACDLLVGSASWFSGWAAVLQPKPWVWYSCAHGAPPWGRRTASIFAGKERELPPAFLASAAELLVGKNQTSKSEAREQSHGRT